MGVFGRVSLYQDNPGEAASPTVNNDITQGYTKGSRWIDTRAGIQWICTSEIAGAAKWMPITGNGLIALLLGADMNATTDQPFIMLTPLAGTAPAKIFIDGFIATNGSISMTTAVGGIYDTAAKGGNAIVAAAQTYAVMAGAPADVQILTLAAPALTLTFDVAPILSLTTPQGAPATADFYMLGFSLPY